MSGLLVRLFEKPPNPSTPAAGNEKRSGLDAALIEAINGGYRTSAGVSVTPDNALTYSAVWACVKVLAESVASLPLILYRRLPNGGKDRATDHPLYSILHDAPNNEMASTDWRESVMANLALWGNGYTQIIADKGGRVRELWPLLSKNIEIKRNNAGALIYHNKEHNAPKPDMKAAEIMHVRSMSMNGVQGISPITQARQAVGLGLATEQYGSAFFGNGANPGIMLEHPGTLSDEAYARLRGAWDARTGTENAHKPVILEEGMKIEKIGVPPDDAQFLETRKFQIDEVARWYRIPPHMIGDLEHATFSNIEHQALDFVVHSLRPWLVRWEQAISRSLLSEKERQTLFAEFLVDGMLRGDTASRYTAYSIGRQWGWFSVNDIRKLENQNPVDGGDTYMAPMNMVELGQFGKSNMDAGDAGDKKEEGEKGSGGDGEQGGKGADEQQVARMALGHVYRDAMARVMRRFERDVREAARKYLGKDDTNGFYRWLDGFAIELREFMAGVFEPICSAHYELRSGKQTEWVRKVVSDWTGQWTEKQLGLMRLVVDLAESAGGNTIGSVERMLREYEFKGMEFWSAREMAGVIENVEVQ